MKNLLYTFLISSLSIATYAAIDTGTGADGSCNWAGPTIASATYNCTDLTISGAVQVTGTTALIIKVQGDVTINNSLTLSGQDGSAGGAGVAGGYNGGAGSTNGSGPSAGTFGNAGGNEGGGFSGDGGGGGSGGAHGSLGLIGVTGTDNGGSTPGAGGIAPTATYGSATLFKTSMSGGAGGGGGGTDGIPNAGGAGGGGGGILRISAGGTVTVANSIIANGGNGNTGSGDSGGGGGGAGGAIFIETNDHIIITGSISASFGNGGAGAGTGGAGGQGGVGIIRLDDSDGSVVGVGLVSPTPSVFQIEVSLSSQTSELKVFSSDIAPGCALRNVDNNFKFGFLFLTILFLASNLLLNFNQRQEIEIRR